MTTTADRWRGDLRQARLRTRASINSTNKIARQIMADGGGPLSFEALLHALECERALRAWLADLDKAIQAMNP